MDPQTLNHVLAGVAAGACLLLAVSFLGSTIVTLRDRADRKREVSHIIDLAEGAARQATWARTVVEDAFDEQRPAAKDAFDKSALSVADARNALRRPAVTALDPLDEPGATDIVADDEQAPQALYNPAHPAPVRWGALRAAGRCFERLNYALGDPYPEKTMSAQAEVATLLVEMTEPEKVAKMERQLVTDVLATLEDTRLLKIYPYPMMYPEEEAILRDKLAEAHETIKPLREAIAAAVHQVEMDARA